MRLLHTVHFSFHEFFGQAIPPYCILSHRWGQDEVTYQDMKLLRFDANGQGYQKIVGSADLARRRGYDWLWVDTCCIDKSSSTELSEAINSMFQWYERAGNCIAYLNDMDMRQDVEDRLEAFRSSKWFTRGWTLQELIAPSAMDFYDCRFKHLGSRYHLSGIISHVTGIAVPYLDGRKKYHQASVAMRLSWSSGRETTRPEDMSYSLLGLLQVNMPLLYGEGTTAFLRLQLRIIETSDDESIFAWLPKDCTSDDEPYGMLAERPADFVRSGHVERIKGDHIRRLPYSFTNKGVAFHQHIGEHNYDRPEVKLTLAAEERSKDLSLAFYLRRVGTMWFRVRCTQFHSTKKKGISAPRSTTDIHTFQIPQPDLPGSLATSGAIGRIMHTDREKNRKKDAQERIYVMGAVAVLMGMVVTQRR